MAQKPSKINCSGSASALFPPALLLASVLLAPSAWAQPMSASEAQQHFQTGVNLLRDPEAPQYEEAYVQFKLAYEKSGKRWTALGNLGLCAFKLERDGEAIGYYETYLQQGGKQINARERAQVERDLLVLKNAVAYATVSADVPQARVTDTRQRSSGRFVNTYALAKDPLRVGLRAGHHTIVASASDRTETWEVDLIPGQSVEHRFSLHPPTQPSAAPPVALAKPLASSRPTLETTAPGNEPKPSPSNIWRTVGFVGLGSGAALLVGGVVTAILGQGAYSSAKDSCVDNRCPLRNQSEADRAATLATVTNVLWISGGLVAAGGLTLVLTHPAARSTTVAVAPPPATFRVSSVPLPMGAGVLASGSF